MKIVLTGYGRMGHMIEEVAQQRGHEVIGRVDVTNVSDLKTMPAADVVIDSPTQRCCRRWRST